jgi:hypothetical protein
METSTGVAVDIALSWAAERLAADFKGTGLPTIEFRVDPTWGGGHAQESPSDVIVVCGGHEFPAGLEGGAEQVCWLAAGQLQDDVMGEHNRPWPELLDADGLFVGVLAPPAEPPLVAVWELAGRAFCAVGHLQSAVAAAGLHIKAVG